MKILGCGMRHKQASVTLSGVTTSNSAAVLILRRFVSLTAVVGYLVCLVSVNALAQSQDQLSYKLGETDLFPSVRFEYEQNSNAYLTADNPTESTRAIVSPELNWVADRRLLTLRGNYLGRYGTNSESALNFADHEFSIDADAELSSRKRAKGELVIDLGHQTLGTSLTRGTADENDTAVQFVDTEVSGEYIYGASNARGNVVGGVELQSFSYLNRSDITSGRGYTRFEPYGIFSLRISPDTRALIELRFTNVAFGGNRADRTDTSLLAGFSFTPTGKFGGTMKVGTTLSSFSGGDSDSTIISEMDLFYEPTSFSRFTLDLEREIDNESANPSTSDAISVVRDTVRLNWRHEWSTRVFHLAGVSLRNVDRGCPDSDLSTTGASFEFNVKVRRWLTIGASASSTNRTSDTCPNGDATENLEYERQIIGAHFRATL